MKKITFTSLLFVLIFMSSCKSDTNNDEVVTDDNEIEVVPKDPYESAILSDTTKKSHEIKEHKENLQKIEKKYGEQWGFCECVVANDSIDKAVKGITDFESANAEKVLDRFEYVSNKCQAFLGLDANKTPEERAKHDKKVKKCLKDAKTKK